MSKVVDILISPISLIVGDKVGHAITGAVLIAAGVVTGNVGLIGLGLSMVASSLTPKPKTNSANTTRLTVSLNPTEARKIAFGGTTALATDMRYGVYTGTNQDHFDQIVCVASHQVHSIDEIWFENQQAWTAGGGVTSTYAGYLTVTPITLGTRVNGIGIDGVWTANSTLTGCAYLYLRYKLTGNSSKATSPFSSSIPSRFTVRGKGALLYDPRLDSTVVGGSGSQRAADQTTWTWSDTTGRNPALQLLFYLLGWKIQNPGTSAYKLAVGRGIPAARIDLPSFITAANICEESVTLAAGGSELRYRSDGIFSEGDDPSTILTNLLASMNATLRDSGGKISLICFRNDLGSPVATLTEADVLGNESWAQSPPFNQIFNIVRGRYTDPSNTALYQLSDFPEVPGVGQPSLSLDGIDRIDTVDYSNVQSAAQAQRLAKQRLQRNQYQGTYSGDFGVAALQVSLGDPIQFSHAGLGWSNKPFRVTGQSISPTGVIKLVLLEENAAIYAWSAEDSAAVTPGAPTVYNPSNSALVAGIGDAAASGDINGGLIDSGSGGAVVPRPNFLLGTVGSGAKLGDSRQLPNISNLNLSYKFTGGVTYSAAAGTPASATISVAAGSIYSGSVTLNYNAMSVTVHGTGGTSQDYWLYVDDPANAGGTQTLVATVTANDVYQADGRVYIGYVNVAFPSSGTGSGGGLGGGGGGSFCVWASAWVETRNRGFVRAAAIEPGDILRVLDEDRTGTTWEPCTGNMIAGAIGWRIVSSSGIEVTVSESTPIVLRDGTIITVPEASGHALPVIDHAGFRWEPCEVERVGAVTVAKILCGQRVYAAGDRLGRQILTHNPKP